MGPWARQAEFESGLARLRKPSPALLEELTALALAEPRSAYKGVIGALAHAIKKAKARHRLPLLSLLSAVLCEARDKFGAANLYAERARPELVRCVAAACRCPPEQLDEVGHMLAKWAAERVFPAEVLRCCEEAVEEAVATRLPAGGNASDSDSDYDVDPAAFVEAREPSPVAPPPRKKAWPGLPPPAAPPPPPPQQSWGQPAAQVAPLPPTTQQPWQDRSPPRRRSPARQRSRSPQRRRSRSPPRHGHERRRSRSPPRHAPPPQRDEGLWSRQPAPPPLLWRSADESHSPRPPPQRPASEDYDPFAPR